MCNRMLLLAVMLFTFFMSISTAETSCTLSDSRMIRGGITGVVDRDPMIGGSLFDTNEGEKDCDNTPEGFTPINDLGIDMYMGEHGGLYPGGVNKRPAFHTFGGLDCGDKTIPRDKDGNPDETNGKIVFMSVGISNCRREFTRFIKDATELPGLNPKLILFNGAIGGMVTI